MTDHLLIRIELTGPIPTGNPSSIYRDRRFAYRERIQSALRTATWARPIPATGALGVRIEVSRPSRRRGDPDNIAKPILDALGPLIGLDGNGRSDDDRVRHLEVIILEAPTERIVVEIHRLERVFA